MKPAEKVCSSCVAAGVLLAALLPFSFADIRTPSPDVKALESASLSAPPVESNSLTLERVAHRIVAAAMASALPTDPQAKNAPAGKADLERVLTLMDATAEKFRSAQANFVWDQYQKVVDESDSQKGRVFYRRNGNDVQMAADVTEPDARYVLVAEGKIQLYQPKIDQITVYNAGKNREAFESFLLLGFGGGGHDMLKSFDVRYMGTENLDGVNTAKLDLVPKSDRVRNTFSHILLWIDPTRGVSLQQQLFDPSGDYRLAKYSDIQLNQKLPENAFKIKTTGKTKTVSPQG